MTDNQRHSIVLCAWLIACAVLMIVLLGDLAAAPKTCDLHGRPSGDRVCVTP